MSRNKITMLRFGWGIAPMCLGALIFLCSTKAFAECGDYVIVGNKTKLAELHAAGFETDSMTNSNSMTSSHSSESKIIGSSESDFFGYGSIPTPCSGPRCNSNSIPDSQPITFTIELSPAKSLRSTRSGFLKLAADSFFGFSEFSEKPLLYKLSIDRPPQ